MFKSLFLLIFAFSTQIGFSQSTQSPQFFAQCLVDITTTQQADELTLSLRSNPFVAVARVDWPTKRIFILTKDITSFTEVNFNSWLGTYASSASCIQVGLHGVDVVNPYPFINCNN
ncbi:MAG: hypothetical protein PHQ74_07900 [Crocinitomicaceae bacterium]|nr:hypothetical protein [Crocinitomicaceae bacterium]